MRDLNIIGEGSVVAGEYGQIKVIGSGNFVAPVKADRITILGAAEVKDLEAQKVKVMGSARFDGWLKSQAINVTGAVECTGKVKANRLVINGFMKCTTDVETEHFLSRGAFDFRTLNANDVEISLAERSFVREIGAENVSVEDKGFLSFVRSLFGKRKRELNAESIEADNIYLERTCADIVKGNSVTIARGCKIKRIEFKDSLSIDKSSTVEQFIQI